MQLAKDEYRALEDIVGPEYITQEPVIMETYNQVWGNKLFLGIDDKQSTAPAAVLLPTSTSEIQAIVRICNKYGILFKALSSGFSTPALALEKEKGILLDLRRMNRILEIDAKNMYAVVEPYVSVYRLQLEAAKYSLYLGRIGAGYSAGVVATTCCHAGQSRTMVFTSGYGRNTLGAEWVLPTGEVLTLGAGESGGKWFSADGPGFSLRGILRGRTGANGGHGIITKASAKLYPWYGPPEWERVKDEGEPLSHGQIERVPDGFKVFVPTFPTADDALSAGIEYHHAEILYSYSVRELGTSVFPEGNDENVEKLQKINQEDEELANRTLVLVIGGHSSRELEYREKCVLAICEKWGGQFLPQFNESRALARAFTDLIWSIGVPALRATGDLLPTLASADGSLDTLKRLALLDKEIIPRYESKGAITAMGGKGGVFWRGEENLSIGAQGITAIVYDSFDPSSLGSTREFVGELVDPQGNFRRFGVPARGGLLSIESVTHIHQNWGPLYDDYDYWLRKIKAMLDPNNVADWSGYIPLAYPEEGTSTASS
jgi:glycolate oxidase